MPQMSSMFWLLLMVLFFAVYFLFIVLIYWSHTFDRSACVGGDSLNFDFLF